MANRDMGFELMNEKVEEEGEFDRVRDGRKTYQRMKSEGRN